MLMLIISQTFVLEAVVDKKLKMRLIVCSSGCNYTSIQTAVDNSDANNEKVQTKLKL